MPQLEAIVDKHVLGLAALIQQKYLSRGAAVRRLDMGRLSHFFTLDVISELALGQAFGDLECDADVHGFVAQTERSLRVSQAVMVWPRCNRLVRLLWSAEDWFPMLAQGNTFKQLLKCGPSHKLTSPLAPNIPVPTPSLLSSIRDSFCAFGRADVLILS